MCSLWDFPYSTNCQFDHTDDYEIEIYNKHKKVIPDIKNGQKYYTFPNQSEFFVVLHNNTDKKCVVTLFIKNKKIDDIIINKNDYIKLDHFPNSKKFIFYEKYGEISIDAKFVPEKTLFNTFDISPKCDYDYHMDNFVHDRRGTHYSQEIIVDKPKRVSQRFGNTPYRKKDFPHANIRSAKIIPDTSSYLPNPYTTDELYDNAYDDLVGNDVYSSRFPACHCDNCGCHDYKRLAPTCKCRRK